MHDRQQRRLRWAQGRADAHYRRLFRQQVWQQRRARLRWEVRRARIESHGRWHRRSVVMARQTTYARDAASDLLLAARDGASAGSGRIARGLAIARRPLVASRSTVAAAAGHVGRSLAGSRRRASRAPARRTWRPPRRIVLGTAVVLLAGVAGYAGPRSLGELIGGGASAEETARSAAALTSHGARVPGFTRPGIFVSVGVTDAGRLEVSEHARTGKSVVELSITPPPALRGSPRRLPWLEGVRVIADGRPIEGVPPTVEVTTVVPLVQPATVIELHYRVVDASARSKTSARGRATVSLRPALASTLSDSRAMIEVHGTRVHSLMCVDLPPKQQRCGVDRADGWRTQRLDSSSSAVVALVDLPKVTA